MARRPAGLAAQFAVVHRVAPVVARAIGHEADEARGVAGEDPLPGAGARLDADRLDQPRDQFEVGHRLVARDVVGLARNAVLERRYERGNVVVDVQPVAHRQPVAVKRHRIAGEDGSIASATSFSRCCPGP